MISLLLFLASSPLWVGLDAGPYSVGFETMPLRDYARPFGAGSAERDRVLTVSIWYPAGDSMGREPMPFSRYVGTGAEELVERFRASGHALDEGQISSLYETPTAAFDGLERSPGSFPLLLFGAGLSAPSYVQSVLCEYLASHGYVVVAVATLPYREDVPAGYDALTVDTLLRDIELVIHEMHDYPGVDLEKLGLVAWSVSGVSHVLLQMKNPDVSAVASLDAATGYAYGIELLRASLYFDPARTRAAFFHATDSRAATSRAVKNFEYYDSIHRGPSFFLTIDGMTHTEFTSLGSVVPGDGTVERHERYRRLCLYVRRFLDDALKNDESAAEFLDVTPSRHGFDGLILSKRR